MNTTGLLDSLARDLRYAVRRLLRRPAFTAAVVLTLALGIGANTAIFAVVNAVLINPLPYPKSSELVSLQHVAPGLNAGTLPMSVATYFTYRDENRTFSQLGVWNDGGATVLGAGDPEQARARWVTYGVLPALGVQPILGRWFAEADDSPAAEGPYPVILSYSYWQRKFGGDLGVVGRTLTVDTHPAQIIGVMPAGFRFLNMVPEAEVILPFRPDPKRAFLDGFGLPGVARLKPGVTLAEAQADVARMLPIWLEAWPPPPGFGGGRAAFANWRVAPALVSLKDTVVGNITSTLWVLMGTIGAVLLIACANVANLMLVRTDARRQEFSVRAALGASRSRIATELFVESGVLGAIGGAVGLALAYVGLKSLVALGPVSLPRLQEISVDPRVLGFVIAASIISSLLFGAIPVWKHAAHTAGPLGLGARSVTASRERHRARNMLLVAQVAIALVLIVCSGLMLRTFMALRDVDPGFTRPDQVQISRVALTPFIGQGPERFTQLERQMLERIADIPGVESASFAFGAPMEGRSQRAPLYVEGQTYVAGATPPLRRFQMVAPGYFETIGTRLIAGRDITWQDLDSGGRVAVISESLARELWGAPAAAVGKRIRESAPDAPGVWREVAGVVQDVHEDGMDQDAPPLVYWPVRMENFRGQAQMGVPFIAFVIRSARAGTASLVGEIRQAIWSVNADLPVFLERTLEDLYAGSLARTSFTLVMLAIAAAMALGLGVVGIYGVMAYLVSQRTPEIGIRLALGAQPGALKRMIVLQGLAVVAVGVVVGLVAAIALTRLMASLLFGVNALDVTTYAAALGVLVAAAALASYLPARRAATIDPIETLRAD